MPVRTAEEALYFLGFGDVRRFSKHHAAGRLCHFFDGAGHRFAGTPADGYRCSFAQQPLGDRAADTSRPTRYNRCFAGENSVHQ